MINWNSPTQKYVFDNKIIYVKRDDLLSKDFSGNKARKFFYFFKNDFPHVKKIVSYGSNQSNAMYSLSVLAKLKGWVFDYYVTHIPEYLQNNPHGNYKYALANGMNIYIGEMLNTGEDSKSTLYVEEGGREVYAADGLKMLADEILAWKAKESLEELNVFLPAGTGTTALFLSKYLTEIEYNNVSVYTTACVGDNEYLKKQFKSLEENERFYPKTIMPFKKRHFGKLYRESYNIWLKLRHEMGIEFDLLYDPHGWLTLLENPELFDKPLLYIHQGGLLGNESMLKRYERKYNENI